MAHPSPAGTPVPPPASTPATSEPAAPKPATSEPATAEPVQGSSSGRPLAALAVLSGAAALVWIVASVLAAGHGFDRTDEGFYLLSYRWWSVIDRTFTGVQYIYGPVFQALGYDIAGLRLFRLITVVATLAAFGWSYMRWLRTRRPNANPSRWWEAAGTTAIVAAGGAAFGWLPLSPGYNDVELLGSMLTLAVVFRVAADTERGRRVPAWVPVAWGPIAFAMLFAKWASSILVLLVAAVVLIVVLWPRRYRAIVRFAAWTIASMIATVAFVHFAIIPLTSVVPEMLAINKIVAAKTNSPQSLLAMYARTTWAVVVMAARTYGLLMIALVLAVVIRGKRAQRLTLVLVVAGLALALWRALRGGGLTGGTLGLRHYPAVLVAILLLTLVAGLAVVVAERRRRSDRSALSQTGRRGWMLFLLLLAMPYLQAMGTGNAVHLMAVNGFAAWMAILIAVVTGMERAPLPARAAMAAVAAGAVLAGSSIGAGGQMLHPYRTDGYPSTTAAVAGVPALDSLRLTPEVAKQYSDLYATLRPYVDPPGRAIMAFDELSGVVLLLDGRPVGEAWYSYTDRQRSAAGIIATCRENPWWGSRLPLLVFKRPVSEVERSALKSCGLDMDVDYTLLAPPPQTMNLTVYVPTAEKERR